MENEIVKTQYEKILDELVKERRRVLKIENIKTGELLYDEIKADVKEMRRYICWKKREIKRRIKKEPKNEPKTTYVDESVFYVKAFEDIKNYFEELQCSEEEKKQRWLALKSAASVNEMDMVNANQPIVGNAFALGSMMFAFMSVLFSYIKTDDKTVVSRGTIIAVIVIFVLSVLAILAFVQAWKKSIKEINSGIEKEKCRHYIQAALEKYELKMKENSKCRIASKLLKRKPQSTKMKSYKKSEIK